MISLSKLRAFSAVAEHGSFAAAAKSLGVSSPALSAQLSELEKSLGMSLLHRTTRRVELTSEGSRLLARVTRVLYDLDSITDDLQSEARLDRGRVVVSCVPTIAAGLFPEVIATFAAQYPQVQVHLIDESTRELSERVMKGEADFGVGPKPDADLAFDLLASDPFVLACAPKDPLAERAFVTGRDLLKLPLIVLARGSNVRTVVEDYFDAMGAKLTPRFEVNHHYTLGALVNAGLGYGLLPNSALVLTANRLLKSVSIRRPQCERSIGVITRRGDRLSPAASKLLETIRPIFARPRAVSSSE